MSLTEPPISEPTLRALQHQMFDYFINEANASNGLVLDKTQEDSPSSIAVVGFALAAYPIGVEGGFITRAQAIDRTLATLRFFWNSPQGTNPDATGYKGFYYHFLDMDTGARVWKCELSTIDTAFLLAGMLTAAAYFDRDSHEEQEIRRLADALYRRADWRWAQNGRATVSHGWTPEKGFLQYRWEGYDEALLLYTLGLGSPTYALPEESYLAWCSTYEWKQIYGHEFLYGGPLFIHQFSHMWIDFRGIQDRFMHDKGSTTSRTAGGQRTSSVNTQSTTLSSSTGTTTTAGESPPATVQARRRGKSRASSAASTIISRAGHLTGRMTARSLRGRWWPRCRSRLRSSCR